MTDAEMASLFDSEFDEQVGAVSKGVSNIRCKCGMVVPITLPSLCPKCQDPKPYWRERNGNTIPLSKMGLGHLTNTVRILAARAEAYPQGEHRTAIEIAMDLIYQEIGSRDKEITQVTGMMAALNRSLGVKA